MASFSVGRSRTGELGVSPPVGPKSTRRLAAIGCTVLTAGLDECVVVYPDGRQPFLSSSPKPAALCVLFPAVSNAPHLSSLRS